jgi:uncharacterized protein YjfI (DUF2170 family)
MVKLEFWVPQAARDDVKAAVRAIVTDSTRAPALAPSPILSIPSLHPWSRPSNGRRDRNPLDRADHQDGAGRLDPDPGGELTLRVLEGAEPVLLVTMHEYGDLPIYLSVGGAQIVVSVLLWPVSEQADPARFNEFLLKAQRVVPLSNFAITAIGGEDVYELMGELSCKTTLQTILIELRTLAENAIDATALRETFDA